MIRRMSEFLLSGRGRALIVGFFLFCFGYWAGVNRSPDGRFERLDTYSALDRKTGQRCWMGHSGPTPNLPTCFDVYRGSLPRWFVGDPMRYAPVDFDSLARKYGGQPAH